jgi:hypothetical protein
MLGLPKKSEKPVPQTDFRSERQNRNERVLVPTMVGPHMILIPRPEHDRGTETLPGLR